MPEQNITVVDSIMGSGKTTWAIHEIDSHPEKSYIYCTPLLDEIERIKSACDRTFSDPKPIDGRKLVGFNHLLEEGRDIAVTHSTFSHADRKTIGLLKQRNYTLILDEAIDVLVPFNDVAAEKIKSGDIDVLVKEGFISCDSYNRVSWEKDSYPNSGYSDVERLARSGNLFLLGGKYLIWQFPPELLSLFEDVYVLTYLFDGSILQSYFAYHGLPYCTKSIGMDEKGERVLTDYNEADRFGTRFRDLIAVFNDPKGRMNTYPKENLSKSWYKKAGKKKLAVLQNNVYNYFHNRTKAKAKDILWTCPKAHMNDIKGSGYTRVRNLTKGERNLPAERQEKLQKSLSCFLPCNARATNDYQDRSVLVYAVNFYLHPYIGHYFDSKNKADKTNLKPDNDKIALAVMLRWIWRSRIRNNEPIQIYIPSERMRMLLEDWLKGKSRNSLSDAGTLLTQRAC